MLTVLEWFKRLDLPKTAILLGLLTALGIIVWEVWSSRKHLREK